MHTTTQKCTQNFRKENCTFHYNLCVWSTKRETACQEAFNENNYCQIVTNDAIQEEREKERKDTQEATPAVPYKFTDLQFG